MQKHCLAFPITLAVIIGTTTQTRADQTNPAAAPKSAAESEAAYTQTIEKRVADILAVLNLIEPAKLKSVHDILVAQYRALRDWHDANDAERKSTKGEEAEHLKVSLKAIHDKFLASLSVELMPDQIEKVKDKMTYGKVQFTYTGYLFEYPNLNEPQKQRVLELLKEAREEAMDGGSSDEKSAIFNRYKGKINNYLSAQGISSNRKKKADAASTNSSAAH